MCKSSSISSPPDTRSFLLLLLFDRGLLPFDD